MSPSLCVPKQRVAWVRVRGMLVFWPACVYASYSAATRDAHDVAPLRASKPVLDDEDRVVAFFGIGAATSGAAAGGIASHAGVAPNLKFCVAPQDELTAAPWVHADDLNRVCLMNAVGEDAIARVKKNGAFRRACEEAARFSEEADSEEDACRLNMEFLMAGHKPTKQEKETVLVRRPVAVATQTSPATKPREQAVVKKPEMVQTHSVETAVPTTKLSADVTTACWSRMQADGWTTFVQPGGIQLYTMPGVQFFEFQPNVTVFDSLDNACIKFLQVWTETSGSHDSEGELDGLVWNAMIAHGWQTIQSANETMFIMPNTTFDRFIPNVTIFQSKRMAIAKFLESIGVGGDARQPDDAEAESRDNGSEVELFDEDVEEGSDVEMSQSADDLSDGNSGSEADEDGSESEEEDDDEKEEEEEIYARVTKRPVAGSTNRGAASRAQTKAKKDAMKKAIVVVPEFKAKWGNIEVELGARGWFWKPTPAKVSLSGWMYYKPHCAGEDLSEMKIGEDCFPGGVIFETYLEDSGLYHEIVDKLRRDHELSYRSVLEKEQEKEQLKEEKEKVALKKRVAAEKAAAKAKVIEISDDDSDEDEVPKKRKKVTAASISAHRTAPTRIQMTSSSAARRKPAKTQIKRVRAPASSKFEVKFGEVWRKLGEKGWTCRPGRFEFDYVKPAAKRKQNGVDGEDYFSSKSALEDYLKESGIWDAIAFEIQREEEEESDAYVEIKDTPVKRKSPMAIETGKDQTPLAKKQKLMSEDAEEFKTPPNERNKRSLDTRDEEETAATQDLSSVMEAVPHISPESISTKAKQDDSAQDGTSLARNLNDAFTPSPRTEKRSKSPEPQDALSTREFAQQSVAKLTLGYQPQNFSHREIETRKIEEFCRGCFAENRGGSVYLSGAPGCGKTALLRSLTDKIGQMNEAQGNTAKSIVPVHLNAMGISDFNQLFCQVAETLTNKEFADGDEAFEAIVRGTDTTYKRSKTLLLVLDEIDALGKSSMENELCRLFELAHRPTHSFILVGIANQIDFTERHLASLRQQLPDTKPLVIVFKPYSFQTISEILLDRLGGEASAARLLNVNGVAFIARKVAAQSGDVRLALDICRRVLQQKLSDLVSAETENYGSPIPLMEIVKTIKAVLEGQSKSNVPSLPRNLQMILFASTRLVAQTNVVVSSSSPTGDAASATHTLYRLDDLYSCYCDVSHDAGVFKPLTRGEFKLGLETLSSEGMIGAAELKKQLIKLLHTPSELLQTFKNDAYFSRLI